MSDAGNYRCVVTNAYGSDTSDTATLAVTPGQPGDYDGDRDVDQSDFGHFPGVSDRPTSPRTTRRARTPSLMAITTWT